MSVNNFRSIYPILDFRKDDSDTFYHLQIIKRKKENPEIGSNSRVIKTYYLDRKDALLEYEEEIKLLCKQHNARACINLNRRSYEKTAFQTLRKVADQIMNKDFRSVKNAFNSVCGAHMDESFKKWVIDIDSFDEGELSYATSVVNICDPLEESKLLMTLPTKNGYHLIVSPFNVMQFKEYYKQQEKWKIPDIHKNNPTILYIGF
jgi:hypothetical protein